MILLDTNVLSAMMRDAPDAAVEAWLDRTPAESVWTTAVTVFEIRYGLEVLPLGRRRRRLEVAFAATIEAELEGRVVPFDAPAAEAAGKIAAELRRIGRTLEIRDAQIAGITAVRKAALATRNARDFDATGLTLIDPWAA